MGAWGEGSFENDAAADWVYELEESRDSKLIEESLAAAAGVGDAYLEAPECCVALAAAEVVAAIRGNPGPDLPEDVKVWIASHKVELAPEQTRLALKAVARVRSSSELRELWDETDESAKWLGTLDDLQERLSR